MLAMLRTLYRIAASVANQGQTPGIARTLLAAFLSCNAAAQDLTEFNNGEVADADELNANFAALEQRISALQSSYEAIAVADGFRPLSITRIPHTSFLNLCGDESGCVVRLCRTFPDDPNLEYDDVPECGEPRHVAYDVETSRWRAGTFRSSSGVSFSGAVDGDGDGSTSNRLSFSFCALSDGESLILTLNDNANGLSLSNSSSTAGFVCSIVLSD